MIETESILELIDKGLFDIKDRSLVSTEELSDLLLDIRVLVSGLN